MKKRFLFLLAAICLISVVWVGFRAQASNSDYTGQIIKIEDSRSLYYVTAENERYVFPNDKTYKTWFTDYSDVVTISRGDLESLPLGGNVVYRPGVLLVKITTVPKVYAISEGGILRWITSEEVAKALYGDDWNMLVDDLPDAFFSNYQLGEDIDSVSDFDPENEVTSIDNIDSNHGMSSAYALRANTRKCNIVGNSRNYRFNADDEDEEEEDYSDDEDAPYITDIRVSNQGNTGYIDFYDEIIITFNEAIDPISINSELEADSYCISLRDDIIGSMFVAEDGVITIEGIASFDIGSVQDYGRFAVKFSLNSNAKILTLGIIAGDSIAIEDEDFEEAQQIGGIVQDRAGNYMEADSDIQTPTGTFGGENVNDGIEPFISSVEVYNGGEDDYIDEGDEIRITFSEEIDPDSIHNDLVKDGSVEGVEFDETGGVRIEDNDGVLTVKNIVSFYVGDIEDDFEFDVFLSLDEEGEVLTITLSDGESIELNDEDLDDAEQIGDVVEDKDGNEMDDDPNIDDPSGSFVENVAGGDDPYITYIKAYNYGYDGYLDVDDQLVITFSEELDPQSINGALTAGDSVSGIDLDQTGGIYVDEDGVLMVTDILSFDIGGVEENNYDFLVELSLSSNGKILTITLTDGDPLEINSENFSQTRQIGDTIEDEDNDVMDTEYDIDNPNGTFGGDSIETPPYVTSIDIDNGNDTDYIDEDDRITITFNEAIDPESIHSSLELDDSVNNVDDDDTGGVVIEDDGFLTVTDIVKFYVGNIDDDSEFEVKLSLNSIGNVLIITLTDGDAVEIDYEDLDDAEQIGGTVEDEDSNEMEDDPRINDPEGSF